MHCVYSFFVTRLCPNHFPLSFSACLSLHSHLSIQHTDHVQMSPFSFLFAGNPLFSQPSSIHHPAIIRSYSYSPIDNQLSIQPIPYLSPTVSIASAPQPLSRVHLYCYMSLILLLSPSHPVIYPLPIHFLLSLLLY